MVRFEVVDVWDLAGRGGLLVVGRLHDGLLSGGTTLRDESTQRTWDVLGVEFHSREGHHTIVVARTGAEPPAAGTHLVA